MLIKFYPSRRSSILGGQMSDLLYEVNDHVGVVTLNRPDAMNSLTYQLYADLEDIVRLVRRALVITGNGRAFCAGDDMKQILGSANQHRPNFVIERKNCALHLRRMPSSIPIYQS